MSKHWSDLPAANKRGAAKHEFPLGTLSPQVCGTCHQKQINDWQGSRHAQSMGPGLLAQFQGDPESFQSCLSCHAPLLEQRTILDTGSKNPHLREDLRNSGLSCAACHVRDGKIFGPPPRDKTAFQKAEAESLHGVFTADKTFEDSRFCSRCHQFEKGVGEFEGVPLENTFQEWQQSTFAKKGISCQNCHMPDRRHLFRGIHDPKMTASGLSSSLEEISDRKFRFTVTSVNIGHFFPTYITPRVELVIEAVNQKGKVVAKNTHVLQRRLDVYLEGQEYDQRLAPGKSAWVQLDVKSVLQVAKIKSYIFVEPDEFYHRFFLAYTVEDEKLEPLLKEALKETGSSPYSIHQTVLQF